MNNSGCPGGLDGLRGARPDELDAVLATERRIEGEGITGTNLSVSAFFLAHTITVEPNQPYRYSEIIL